MPQPNLPIFTALGQPTRWRAFEVLLGHGERGMLQREIAAALGIEKNLMSVHLRILKEADLVSAEKNGREVTYRVTPAAAREAAEILLRTIEGGKAA